MQTRNGEHFGGNAKAEVVLPFYVLGGVWEGEAELAESFDVH